MLVASYINRRKPHSIDSRKVVLQSPHHITIKYTRWTCITYFNNTEEGKNQLLQWSVAKDLSDCIWSAASFHPQLQLLQWPSSLTQNSGIYVNKGTRENGGTQPHLAQTTYVLKWTKVYGWLVYIVYTITIKRDTDEVAHAQILTAWIIITTKSVVPLTHLQRRTGPHLVTVTVKQD